MELLLLFTYKMVIIHSDYILCSRWVLFVTPDSSSRLPGRSMRVLPLPLLLINCLSCSPLPDPFTPPGLTPFPSGSRPLPASSSAYSNRYADQLNIEHFSSICIFHQQNKPFTTSDCFWKGTVSQNVEFHVRFFNIKLVLCTYKNILLRNY